MNLKSTSAFNAKPPRCEDAKQVPDAFHSAGESLSGFGSSLNSPFSASLPLGAFALSSLNRCYIEVRLALVRDDPSKQPVLYDLTLHGVSSGFAGDLFLYGGWAEEGEDAVFWTDVIGAEPVSYQWFRAYPWETNWVEVAGATNWYFEITNVDSWMAGTEAMLFVTNGNSEIVWLGPEYLHVSPAPASIPATNYTTGQGPASRYPMTIRVFDQPTNFNRVSVTVTLWGLTHSRSADLAILLVSPLGTNVMLMSNVGGTNGVSGAILAFQQGWPLPSQSGPILQPGQYYAAYQPSNYGQVEQMPRLGPDPPPLHYSTYSANLDSVQYDNPNGIWKLYIYDFYQQRTGELTGSWQLSFTFQ